MLLLNQSLLQFLSLQSLYRLFCNHMNFLPRHSLAAPNYPRSTVPPSDLCLAALVYAYLMGQQPTRESRPQICNLWASAPCFFVTLTRSNAWLVTATVCCPESDASLAHVDSSDVAEFNWSFTSSICSLRDGALACARHRSTLLARVITVEAMKPRGVYVSSGETEGAGISAGGPTNVCGDSRTHIVSPVTLLIDAASLISWYQYCPTLFSFCPLKTLKHEPQQHL